MIRLLAAALALVAAFPAAAADRIFPVASFDKVRIEGPFEVRVTTGASPSACASGTRDQIDRLAIELNGTTLVVRMGLGGWGETPRTRAAAPPVITLASPRLTALSVNAGARATVDRMAAQRVDLTVAGSGALAVATVETDQLNATLVGTGTLATGGRAQRATLALVGAGAIDAGKLAVNDLTVRLDGTGTIAAAARYTATVATTGIGGVTVAGNPKCIIRAASGPVVCGH